MSLWSGLLATLFGAERNILRETAEVFRENSEAGAERAHGLRAAALAQFASEFGAGDFGALPRGGFDRMIDGLNRLPRPCLALGTIALMGAAMVDPLWFATRMQGVALVPEPLWWLLGIVVSFYFGARAQAKSQEFQQGIARSMGRLPEVLSALETIRDLTPSVDFAKRAPHTEAAQGQQGGPAMTGGARSGTQSETVPQDAGSQDEDDNRALDKWLQSAAAQAQAGLS